MASPVRAGVGAGESGRLGGGRPAPRQEGPGRACGGRGHRPGQNPGYRRPGAPGGTVAGLAMTIPGGWIVAGAALVLAVGLVLMLAGRGMRLRRGLGGGKTVSL